MRGRFTNGFDCMASLIQPKSRGTIRLKSSDPEDYPEIIPNYLDDERDVDLLIQGIRLCQRLSRTPTMQALGAELIQTRPLSPCAEHEFDSREHWACEVKAHPMTLYHPAGSCKMGPDEDNTTGINFAIDWSYTFFSITSKISDV